MQLCLLLEGLGRLSFDNAQDPAADLLMFLESHRDVVLASRLARWMYSGFVGTQVLLDFPSHSKTFHKASLVDLHRIWLQKFHILAF